jgi:hypothetical protein
MVLPHEELIDWSVPADEPDPYEYEDLTGPIEVTTSVLPLVSETYVMRPQGRRPGWAIPVPTADEPF